MQYYFMRTLFRVCTLAVLAAMGMPVSLWAQYSPDVMKLRQAQDLYDERGYGQGSSISVDGSLAVSNQNGSVSYIYPISSFTSGGYSVTTSLSYCGSVAFTAFKDYNLGSRRFGDEYSGWSRFHQNRPAWILGVNGWAVNLIGVATHFHTDPASNLFNTQVTEFNDKDLVWLADGWDFSNRMRDFQAMPQSEAYRDVIRILRADGSVMELLNIHNRTETNNADPDLLPELYSGYYFQNEANVRGYGVVTFDSSQFMGPAWEHMASAVVGGKRYPLYPRVLRYFSGDGTEVIFRERIDPYGVLAYQDLEARGGGLWGHPSIFYLEEIRGNAGTIVEFKRARHTSSAEAVAGNVTTRGRAPVTSFTGHEISIGDRSMTIEALGRTTKIKFGVVSRSGNAAASEAMPYARLGGATDDALELAAAPEYDRNLFKSFTGYISEIVDPMDRATKFTYETYTKRYEATGFPRPGGSIRLSLVNYRLKSITEPAARYVLGYYGVRDERIIPTETNPMKLNSMVDSVRKFDRSGTLLLTDVYRFDASNQVGTTIAWQYSTDNLSGHVRQKRFIYESFPLNNYQPILTPGRHTVLKETMEAAGTISTGITETVTTTTYGTAGQIPGWGGWGNYTVLPVAELTTINGITKGYQEFSYELGTVRGFWRTPELAARYGREITRQVTRQMRPDDRSTLLLVDTTTYLHLPAPDSLLVAGRVRWNKLATLGNFYRLRDTLHDPAVVGRRWEEVMYRPPVAVFDRDTVRQYIPPIFGLVERSWTTTPEGIIAGKRNVYLTEPVTDGEATPRGVLLADSLFGAGGASILKGEYRYRREWSGYLLASVRNALGVETSYSYGPERCLDVPFWEECTASAPVIGTILANDGTTRADTLAWTPFSYWFSKPAGERSIVRRYNALGVLQRDTLSSYSERTFHGLAGATVGANGELSRFAYDYNGRLGVGWLPGDFPGTDLQALPPYEGRESIDLFGATHHHRREDWQHCRADGSSQIVTGTTRETVHHDTLYARLPVTAVPECPCKAPQEMKGDGRELASAPCRDESFPFSEYAGHRGYVGRLPVVLDAAGPITSATRIDSMSFEAMVTSVEGSCVHLEVVVDSIFTRTYVLACPDAEAPDDDNDAPLGKASEGKRGGAEGSRSVQGVTAIGGGYKLVVDLSTIAPQLAARPAGSVATIEVRVKTAGAAVAFINGTNAEDLRPRLNVYGEFRKVWDRADYTLAYEHDDKHLTTVERTKVDDNLHTANTLASEGIAVRRSMEKSYFGADYRLLKNERAVVEPGGNRVDTERFVYTGLGARTTGIDAEGDSVQTRYDALGRPIATVNGDGTEAKIEYIHARPDSLGITDQDFLGYCDLVIATDEKGTRSARFTDALGRVRREVADYGLQGSHSNTTTRFNYDLLGRLVEVINPKGDVTRYTHDEFGRVLTKSHPDLGTISYSYDRLGNVRFMQDQQQAENNTLTYNQYDDLNRVTLVGEAAIDDKGGCAPYNEEHSGASGCGDGTRLTGKLDGNVLHIDSYPDAPLTANPTLFRRPFENVPDLPWVEGYRLKNCGLNPLGMLGETERPTAPFIMHTTQPYAARDVLRVGSNEFEDVESYPETARIGVNYDRMPISSGVVWQGFPLVNIWDRLTPTGIVRNQKSREAAVAYRDRASEPFHYTVMSYDERGRVEALLRYNENLGFDAVYYRYNSGDQVIAVMVADPVRRFTTWYGYDHQERIDSVWTKLDAPGSGLMSDGTFNYLRFPGFPSHEGLSPEIVYSYTKRDQIRTMEYPAIGTLVEYAYNHRTFLDSLVARRGGTTVFSQRLGYDPTGQIRSQEYRHASAGAKKQTYGYDPLDRLTGWSLDGKSTGYQYDGLGNREAVQRSGSPIETYSYYAGTNRLHERHQPDYFAGDTVNTYGYNANGAEVSHLLSYVSSNGSTVLQEEHMGYNFRGLNNRARVRAGGGRWYDWRYRYNAMGEREQKRLYPVSDGVVPNPDSAVVPWVYYLLGGDKQLAVYHGQQVDSTQTRCGDAGKNRVYIYPWEYISYGAGSSGLLITRPTGRREYKLVDHLGSTRAVLDQSGAVVGRYDNTPFGEPLAVVGTDTRKGFIDKEVDGETENGNFGVRQYDAARGSFGSIDPLWEKFPGQSPYGYSYNNPLRVKDPTGKTGEPVSTAVVVIEVAGSVVDVTDAINTLTDPNASGLEKTVTAVGASVGLIAPGAGYGVFARKGLKYADEAISWAGKLFGSADEAVAASKVVKKVPNPFGKKGGLAHQAKVDEIVKDITKRGLTPEAEHMVRTPGGSKSKRYVDVVARDGNGNIVEMHQVGKQTKKGLPVARERRAMKDIALSPDGQAPMIYHAYNTPQ